MGWKYTNAIRDVSPPGERPSSYWLVLHILASYAHNLNGTCYPSMATIAQNARLTPKSVRRQIQQLKKDGFLRVLENANGGKPGDTPLYQLKLSTAPPSLGNPGSPAAGPNHSREAARTTPSYGSQKGSEKSNKESPSLPITRPPNQEERQRFSRYKSSLQSREKL